MNELKIGEREKRAKKARSEIIVIKVRIKKAAVLSIVERETRKGKGRGWPVLSGVRLKSGFRLAFCPEVLKILKFNKVKT